MSKTMEKGTENAIFLDGRGYTAADLYRLIGLLVGNGVYANELAPTATNEDMSVTHGVGHAWISGIAYWNTTPFVLEIATADGSLNRYDSLMLRLNLSINEVYAVIVQGEYATDPTPPTCTRNAETFDLKLCDIYVPAGCTKITQNLIIDTRLDSSVCGVPVFPVEHMDMTTFYKQIAADLEGFKEQEQDSFATWAEEKKKEILDLLQQLNNLVKADTVGELITQINEKLSTNGGDMTGDIDMNMNRVTNIAAPTNNNDAANKDYVDGTELRATLSATGWSSSAPYTQTVAVAGITAEDNPDYWPVYSGTNEERIAQKEGFAVLDFLETSDGSITVTCFEEKPEVDITIGMEVHR